MTSDASNGTRDGGEILAARAFDTAGGRGRGEWD
jgi:hypothetical protein